MSPIGFSGGLLTPSARTLPWGTAGLRYDRQVPGPRRHQGHNYAIGFGVLPYVEAAGRVATNDLHCNMYLPGACGPEGPGIRDLSMSFKVAVPLDADERFSVALGATDLGGAATNFRSYYGALGWRQGAFDLTLGTGQAESRSAVLSGPFARLAVQVLPMLQLSAERVPDGSWVTARLFAAPGWLPDHWQAFVDVNRRIGDSHHTDSSWFAAGLNIPLDFLGTGRSTDAQRRAAALAPAPLFRLSDGAPPSAEAGVQPVAPAPAATATAAPAMADRTAPIGADALPRIGQPGLPRVPAPAADGGRLAQQAELAAAAPPAAGPVDPALLARLAEALDHVGVEDVAVGEQPGPDGGATIVVRADNAGWRWNDLDALGVVLARVARVLAPGDVPFRVVLGRRGVPTLMVDGTAACLAAFLRTGAADCPRGEAPVLRSSGDLGFDRALRDIRWAHTGGNPSWGRTRVTIAPGLRSAVATEYGIFDYSLAAEVGVEVPLWTGASVEMRRSFPLSHSEDYDTGRVYGPDRHRTVTDRVLFHQTLSLGHGVSARAALGRVFDDWRGGLGEVRWQPWDGRHRIGALAGQFRNDGSLRAGFTAEPMLASYRYLVAPLDWAIEVTAGRFFLNDTGWAVGSRHWFGDFAVSAYVRSSAHPNQPQPQRFAGIQFELPLTPRREMDSRWLRIQGADRWSYGVESLVGDSHNLLTAGHGVLPPVPNGLDAVHNHDRASSAYGRHHWGRIRQAAQRFSGH